MGFMTTMREIVELIEFFSYHIVALKDVMFVYSVNKFASMQFDLSL
jgi:hypothetical protein